MLFPITVLIGVNGMAKGILNYKKPIFCIIIAAVIVLIIISVCLLTNPKNDKINSNSANVNLITASTNCDLVSFDFVESKIDDENLFITVKWTNNSDKVFSFGEMFVIYKDGEVLEPVPNVGWIDIANLVLPGQSIEETYNLTDYYDISELGVYRLEKNFYLQSGTNYKAYIEFSIIENE